MLGTPKQPSLRLWSWEAQNWVGNSGKNLNGCCDKYWASEMYCLMGWMPSKPPERYMPYCLGGHHLVDLLIQFVPEQPRTFK